MNQRRCHWHLLGAGNMGTLAAWYLRNAGDEITVVHGQHGPVLDKTLAFADARGRQRLRLAVRSPESIASPVDHLLVACKTPYTAAALRNLTLSDDATVLRLQNGLGSLDGRLPEQATLIEVVTTSAVKGRHPHHEVVAENRTWMGGAAVEPDWVAAVAAQWPGLTWRSDIRHDQWRKLVVNAVINPLTALRDIPNGGLLDDCALQGRMQVLTDEADGVLARLDSSWPGASLPRIHEVIRLTAGNTSSMRADMQRGAATEIDAINGWLLRAAETMGVDLPAHRAVVADVKKKTTRIRAANSC